MKPTKSKQKRAIQINLFGYILVQTPEFFAHQISSDPLFETALTFSDRLLTLQKEASTAIYFNLAGLAHKKAMI